MQHDWRFWLVVALLGLASSWCLWDAACSAWRWRRRPRREASHASVLQIIDAEKGAGAPVLTARLPARAAERLLRDFNAGRFDV